MALIVIGMLTFMMIGLHAFGDRRTNAIDRPAFQRRCVQSLVRFFGPLVLVVRARLLLFGVIQLAAILTRS